MNPDRAARTLRLLPRPAGDDRIVGDKQAKCIAARDTIARSRYWLWEPHVETRIATQVKVLHHMLYTATLAPS